MNDIQAKFITILVTASSEAESQRIASALVEERLAACVTTFPVQSTYRWQDNIQHEQEWQLMIKSQRDLFTSMVSLIQSMHSYDVPEIIALPILEGHRPYLQWINRETSSTPKA